MAKWLKGHHDVRAATPERLLGQRDPAVPLPGLAQGSMQNADQFKPNEEKPDAIRRIAPPRFG